MAKMNNELRNPTLQREVLRQIRNQHYEIGDDGLLHLRNNMQVGGFLDVEHWRKGELIHHQNVHNIVPVEGLTKALENFIKGTGAVTTWYMSIYEGNYTPISTVTAATYTADATESTAYDEATRVAVTFGTPASASVDNTANRADFTINATKTIYGVGLHSASAKSAVTGTLAMATKFSASRPVVASDIISVDYTLSASSS